MTIFTTILILFYSKFETKNYGKDHYKNDECFKITILRKMYR